MALTGEKYHDEHKVEHVRWRLRWGIVNTYLAHIAVEDPAQVIRDLVEMERSANG